MSLQRKTALTLGLMMLLMAVLLYELSTHFLLFAYEGFLLLAIVIVTIGFGVLLDWQILSRLTQLEREVQYIAESKNWVMRLPYLNDDELGRLTLTINHMLDELGTSNRELREERNFVSAVLNTVGALVVVLDPQGRIVRFNRQCEIVTGYSAMEVVGQPLWDRFVRPEDKNHWEAIFTTLKTDSSAYQHINYWRTKTEGLRLIDWSNTVLLHQGKVAYIIATGVDLTEQVSAEMAQRDLEEQLYQAQKLESIGRLAGGVAHDFNNQLTAMMGYARLALRGLSEGEPRYRELNIILESAQRASVLTRQLLAFAREQKTAPTKVNLNELIGTVDTILQQLCGERISLTYELEPNLATVLADPNQLEQVLVNLMVNAVDAMPQGGTLVVRTSNIMLTSNNSTYIDLQPGSYVRLMVQDSGMGIAEDVQHKIFDPFFTTKPVGQGTGLGLATCFGLVTQHGGYIAFESQLGQGATFIVDLPQLLLSDRHSPHSTPMFSEPPVGSGRILLVEDELHVREATAESLERLGYEVSQASNGKEALAMVQATSTPYQLILTDVVMPIMSGYELVAHLQQLPQPIPPILYMSGYIGEISLQLYNQQPTRVPLLAKPFTFEELANAVYKCMGI